MIIAPIIFCTVVSGIAHVADAAKVGRVALKAHEMVQGRSSPEFVWNGRNIMNSNSFATESVRIKSIFLGF